MPEIAPIPLNRIKTRDNLLQSRIWGLAKRGPVTLPRAFETTDAGSLLVLLRHAGTDTTYASVPWGPQTAAENRNGTYLEHLSEALRPHLPASCLFIRYDLPWPSPWEDRMDGPPAVTTRELEMNFGTRFHRLRKAPTDIRPVDTQVVNLARDDDTLLAQMKPKTRYNINLAHRRGVRVYPTSPRRLDEWFQMYRETMARHGKTVHDYEHFEQFFEAAYQSRVAAVLPGEPRRRHNIRLILAEQDGQPLAGMVLAVSGPYAIYLYGASTAIRRNAMPTYLLQWKAMQTARHLGAESYDMFGVPPDRRAGHPMHGLLRFKEGFGGSHITRRGCWDYPLDEQRYPPFAGREAADGGYHR
ncbi:MAG: peptidoglycan bridge formation glycyltransferase FemA/FemB family protein [Spirochaeta sp.]|jgi:lipid II:glycine glycyltransferase (peptidoglycan interpeptide bridge formation enzyme)|nr:peptidoglycan bridge formation glycyltransferase FemA/FemB family protein [Spirochaeta sp.]